MQAKLVMFIQNVINVFRNMAEKVAMKIY